MSPISPKALIRSRSTLKSGSLVTRMGWERVGAEKRVHEEEESGEEGSGEDWWMHSSCYGLEDGGFEPKG